MATGVQAQQNIYAHVDSIMRSYKHKINYEDDLPKLTYFIRTNFDSDSARLRASFIWITENIAYDVKAYLKEDPSAGRIDYALKKKKAICGGYSLLLKYFCDAFNIENSIVHGFGRTGKRGVVLNQRNLRPNHAWNAVKINGTWRLIDATWASGFSSEPEEEKDMKFTKRFDETYYFTPAEKMILNHFPVQNRFQLNRPIVSEMAFKNQTMFLSGYLRDSISKVIPDSSIIRVKKGDTITIRFQTNACCEKICAYSDRISKASFEAFITGEDGWMEFRYPVAVTGYYNLYVVFCLSHDVVPLVVYRLEVN
jgi:transglutaminase/protease-like cytokinesis protein 3